MSNNLFDPPVVVDLGDNPGTLAFTSQEEVTEWAKKETNAWSKLAEAAVPPPFRPRVGEQLQAGAAITVAAAQCFSGDPVARANGRNALEKQFSLYRTYRYTHHATAWGQSVIDLWDESPNKAGAALWAKCQLATEAAGRGQEWINVNSFNKFAALAFDGIARASRKHAGDSADVGHQTALVSIEQSLVEAESRWRTRAAEAEAEWTNMRAAMGKGLYAQTEVFKAQRDAAIAAATKLDEETRQKIKELEQLFGEKIRLEAPVQYWREKVASHNKGAWIWGVLSAAITLSPIAFAIYYASEWFPRFDSLQKGLTAGGVAILLAFAVLYLAFGRQIGRLFVTSLALRNDAAERVVMAQTFLALYHDKKLTDDERKLVLASLFRPHSAPSDNDAPAGLADFVSKAISPQKP